MSGRGIGRWASACVALGLLLICGGEPRGALPAPRPDLVLLISLDTLRADHLGLYGYERPTSPVLDALAGRSVVFEDASAPSPWTLPSHASLLTGLYPSRHGAVSEVTPVFDAFGTLATALRDAGWETHSAVSSTWLAPDDPPRARGYGFMRGFDHRLYLDGDTARAGPNTWITDQVIEWIDRPGDRPKFFFVHYLDIHSDYKSLPEHEALFVRPYEGPLDGSNVQLSAMRVSDEEIARCREETPDAASCFSLDGKPMTEAPRRSGLAAEDVRHLVDLYDAGIHQMDAEIGRLLAHLRATGRLDRTLVVITSDHGEELMEHGNVYHSGTQYQEVLHVPLVLSGPGVPRGARVETPVSLVDVAPTLLALAGAPALEGIEGLDLAPLWHGGETAAFDGRDIYGEAPILSQARYYETAYRSLRRGRWKLHVDDLSGKVELYDLAVDPAEQRDLAAARPERVAELRRALKEREAAAPEDPRSDSVELTFAQRKSLRKMGYLR